MNNTLVLAIVLLLIIGGGYWYMQSGPTDIGADQNAEVQDDLGTYAYMCDNGSEFTMSPSSDMTSVTLEAGSQGAFTGTVTLSQKESSAGVRFEGSHMGSNIAFVGRGEEIQLTVGSELMICNPVPSQDMAPWNWGDAGEGGGVQQDLTVIVSESIVGKWQSTNDATFVREFQAGGKVVDSSNGKSVSSGTFTVFSIDKPLTVSFPLQTDTVYVQMTMQGTEGDTLTFKINKLTPEELELTYMDRGGVLTFKAIK